MINLGNTNFNVDQSLSGKYRQRSMDDVVVPVLRCRNECLDVVCE